METITALGGTLTGIESRTAQQILPASGALILLRVLLVNAI
ncbi:hypothetical protein [Psychrobium sp. 1_MG-2023]|nr:hypothetical protein [Psychrobium sp. 1_MG-2023]MDP2561698.1 hypothetical protein [Psychrobium sp. 1_MG-2023]